MAGYPGKPESAVTITSGTENLNSRRKVLSVNDLPHTHGTVNSTPELDRSPSFHTKDIGGWKILTDQSSLEDRQPYPELGVNS